MLRSSERVLVGTLLLFAALGSVSSARQTSTNTETKTFEVVAVNGNALVVRNAAGTQEFIVPDTFRFTTAGKTLSVHELTPGMKGTATITTTTTVTPVTVTEVKQATVMQATGNSVIVRGENGIRMFSVGDINKRNITILRGGKPVELADLREGDRLTATVVTEGPPKVMTEQDVKASIAAASVPAPAPPPRSDADPVAERRDRGAAPAASAPATATPAAATPATPSTLPESRDESSSGLMWGIVALAAVIASRVPDLPEERLLRLAALGSDLDFLLARVVENRDLTPTTCS